MTKRCIFVIAGAILASACVCFVSCRDSQDHVTDSPTRKSFQKITSTSQLRTAFKPGASTNVILNTWGEPDREDVTPSGIVWAYALQPFPADDDMEGTYVFGVSLGITNGRLATMWFSYSDGPATTKNVSQIGLSKDENNVNRGAIKFFPVSNTAFDNSTFIDTEELPRLGFIAKTAPLVISKVKSVQFEEREVRDAGNNPKTKWAFTFYLEPSEAEGLRVFSESNLLKRVLIMIGDEPIVAPNMMAALDSGRFEIEGDERKGMEIIKKGIEALRGQKR